MVKKQKPTFKKHLHHLTNYWLIQEIQQENLQKQKQETLSDDVNQTSLGIFRHDPTTNPFNQA